MQWTRYDIDPIFTIKVEGDVASVVAGVRQSLYETRREYLHRAIMLDEVFRRAPVSERMSATLAAAVAILAIVMVSPSHWSVSGGTD